MVQTIKRTLRKILGRVTVNYEDLLTIINEIEGMINSRALGFMYNDDIHEILAHSHVIYGRPILPEQYRDGIEDTYGDSVVISKKTKYIQTLIELFHSRWNHEYLTELRESRTCGRFPNKVIDLVEVVLIKSDKRKWTLRKMGEVIKLIKGADGVVRAVLYY